MTICYIFIVNLYVYPMTTSHYSVAYKTFVLKVITLITGAEVPVVDFIVSTVLLSTHANRQGVVGVVI